MAAVAQTQDAGIEHDYEDVDSDQIPEIVSSDATTFAQKLEVLEVLAGLIDVEKPDEGFLGKESGDLHLVPDQVGVLESCDEAWVTLRSISTVRLRATRDVQQSSRTRLR